MRAVDVFLPTQLETVFFQAVLNSTPTPETRFAGFLESLDAGFADFFAVEGRELRGQLAGLHHAMLKAKRVLPQDLNPYLMTASLRAKLRLEMFEACLKDGLVALHGSAVPFVAVKGVACAFASYDHPVLRHCHDADFVLRSEDQSAAAHALQAAGFVQQPTDHPATSRFDHPTGLPMMLHAQPLSGPFDISADWILAERRYLDTPVGVLPVPEAAKTIVHTVLHGVWCQPRMHCNWVPDAITSLRRCSPSEIGDFQAYLIKTAPQLMAGVPLAYLARHFDDLPLFKSDLINEGQTTGPLDPEAIRHLLGAGRAWRPAREEAFRKALSASERCAHLRNRLFPARADLGLHAAAPAVSLWFARAKRIVMIAWWRSGLNKLRLR